MTDAHTPTPWSSEPQGGKGAWIRGANGRWAAMSCGGNDENADANAAFLVKAVNNHQPLFDALVMAREWMSSVEAPLCDTTAFKRDRDAIDAALDLAAPHSSIKDR